MMQQENKAPASTTRFRWVMAGIAAVFILPIAGLMSIPFLIGDPLAVVRPDAAPTTIPNNSEDGAFARIQMNRGGSFMLELAFSRAREDTPRIEVRMPEHGMATPPRAIRPLAPGRFQVDGQFAMPGRWQITVDYGVSLQVLEFIVGEY